MAYFEIFDSHAHYTDSAFAEDRDALLAGMPAQGVSHIVLQSVSVADAEENLKLLQTQPWLFAAVGIHPEEIDAHPEADFASQIALLRTMAEEHDRICAIGEIGLDYHYDSPCRQQQMEAFQAQLELALALSLPVCIHCRDATGDCMEILRPYCKRGLRGVMHCFSGSAETAEELVRLGFYIGFTGVVTFKNARRALEAIDVIPIHRLLIETDCPYMAPVPHRGKRCDSSMLPLTAEAIASRKGLSVQEVLSQTCKNGKQLFQI